MIITHHGGDFVKVSFGDTTLAFNPISKESKLKQTRFGADIVLISYEHEDMNGVSQVTYGDREPFVVRGPGEYEVRDVLIKGYATKGAHAGTARINTAYLVTLEGMLMLYLGVLADKQLPSELKEQLDNVDILFVPIGGQGVLEPDDAHEFAVSIEPRIVVPIHYQGVGKKDALELFLKEDAKEHSAPVEKLTLKRKDLENRQNDIVVIQG